LGSRKRFLVTRDVGLDGVMIKWLRATARRGRVGFFFFFFFLNLDGYEIIFYMTSEYG
jgi:hypothetical protein